MLSRSETVMKLINIRKVLKEKEDNLKKTDELPDDYHSELKDKLDQLLIEVIGVPEAGQHEINKILQKAIKGEIKEKTAVVAVHEIFKEYNKKNTSSQKNKDQKKDGTNKDSANKNDELQELYKSGYR